MGITGNERDVGHIERLRWDIMVSVPGQGRHGNGEAGQGGDGKKTSDDKFPKSKYCCSWI